MMFILGVLSCLSRLVQKTIEGRNALGTSSV